MIEVLKLIRQNLKNLILEAVDKREVKTMYIDYHPPFVQRLWFEYEGYRIFLHKIERVEQGYEPLFHPHKWNSAMEVLHGSYEMGIGHSSTNEKPPVDCKLILTPGSMYEMMEKDAWHYVKPLSYQVITLMVTGELNGRVDMPIEPKKEFRKLTENEIGNLLFSAAGIDFRSDIKTRITNSEK